MSSTQYSYTDIIAILVAGTDETLDIADKALCALSEDYSVSAVRVTP